MKHHLMAMYARWHIRLEFGLRVLGLPFRVLTLAAAGKILFPVLNPWLAIGVCVGFVLIASWIFDRWKLKKAVDQVGWEKDGVILAKLKEIEGKLKDGGRDD